MAIVNACATPSAATSERAAHLAPITPIAAPAPQPARKLTADSILETLSLRQKVGQLIMPWLIGRYAPLDGDDFAAATEWVDRVEIGGIVISIGSPLDAAAKLNALQERSRLPLIIAADLEYGAGMRMIGATAFPQPMGFGATGRELDAYQLGRVTAVEARAIGIHWTFSPVADLNNNPANPVINTRAFGESSEAVSTLIQAYIRGASDHGLFTTVKHFPGHGDTGSDSHIDLPVVPGCWSRLDSLELEPFRAGIEAGVTSVMTAHVALPCLGDGERPATLSPVVMQGVLRDSLGFDGVVVTDALTMGAIINEYGIGESAVLAFLAGSDLLLYPTDVDSAANAMLEAATSGRITPHRLDASVRRILDLKVRAGLFERRTVDLTRIPEVVGRQAHQAIADDIAARSITLVQRGTIETIRAERGQTALISYAAETNLSIGGTLTAELRALGEQVTSFRLYPASGPASYDSARAVIDANPHVLFASGVRPISGLGHIALPDSLADLILETDARKPTILVSFGSPYLLSQLPAFSGGYLLAWQNARLVERAVARAIAGEAPITGRLPITLSDRFRRGHGIMINGR